MGIRLMRSGRIEGANVAGSNTRDASGNACSCFLFSYLDLIFHL